jgi:hypothetical protein
MHHVRRPGLSPAPAALAAAGCLLLAACGGSSGHHGSAKPSAPKSAASTAPAEPVSGPAAVAAVTANWETVFDGKAAIPARLALVQDGPQLTAFIENQAKTPLGKSAAGSSATVAAVTITSPSQATVHYEVLLLGTPLLKNQVGIAVYQDGVWKVGIGTTCGLAYLEYSSQTSSQLPAICRK